MILDDLAVPIVLAPLAGGPSTPELTAAVSAAGGFGFLAAGYLTADGLRDRVARVRALTGRPFGVNLFVPGTPSAGDQVAAYVARISAEAARAGAALGEPRFDDDAWEDKLDLLAGDPVPVVSFTFGCPPAGVVARLRRAGTEVWVTVTGEEEGRRAAEAGADVLVAQGAEAGGHRGGFTDDPDDPADAIGLLPLLQLLRHAVDVPVVGGGGIATGAGVAAVLAAGASAAQLGTAFLRCPEAGTAAVHRRAVATATPTALTRAFTGRLARGIRNRFLDAHTGSAPAAYPEIHYVTAPLRRAAREAGDPEPVNLWAGQAHALAPERPAGELVAALAAEAEASLRAAAGRLSRRAAGTARPGTVPPGHGAEPPGYGTDAHRSAGHGHAGTQGL